MPTCDVCNVTVSEFDGTVYSADEFRSLVRQGYEPPALTRSMMTAMGMPLEQWKSGLVASSTTAWLLCPSCAAGARRLIPRAPGVSAGTPLVDKETDKLLLGLLAQAQAIASAGKTAETSKKQVPCPHCGASKDENQNPCPHCGFTEWLMILTVMILALGCVAAAVFWFESVGWLIATWVTGALFGLLGSIFLIKNLVVLRRDRARPASRRNVHPTAEDEDEEDEDEDDDDEDDDEEEDVENKPAPARRAEPPAQPPPRPTWTLQARRHKRFDCHSKSYEGTKRLVISPDGRWLASAGGSQGGDICLFDLTANEQVATLEAHTYYGVTALVISPDSHRLVSTGDNNDGKVRVWSLPDGALIHDLKGNSFDNRTLAISPDGRLVAGAGGGDNAIRLWHLEDGTEFKVLKGHADRVNKLAFTPDGKYLVSADNQGVVRIWSFPSGEMLARCRTDAGDGVQTLAVSPDSKYTVSGTHTHVRVWSISDAKLITSVDRLFWIHRLEISPDGKLLAASGSSGDPGIWDFPTGHNLRELKGHKNEVTCLAFSPDGRFLASGSQDQDVLLWGLPDGVRLTVLEDHPGHVTSLAIGADSRSVVVGSKDGSITFWTVTPEGEVPPARAATKPVTSGAVAGQETLLITCQQCKTKLRVKAVSAGKKVKCPRCKQLVSVPQPATPAMPAAVPKQESSGSATNADPAPNVGRDKSVIQKRAISLGVPKEKVASELTHLSSEQLHLLAECADGPFTVYFLSPSGTEAKASAAREIGLRRKSSHAPAKPAATPTPVAKRAKPAKPSGPLKGTRRKVLPGHDKAVKCLVISPDGRFLAASTGVWRLPDLEPVGLLDKRTYYEVFSLAISPDSQLLVATGYDDNQCKRLHLFDLPTGRHLRTWDGPDNYSRCAVFTPDAATLVTATYADHALRLWRVPEGTALNALKGHADDVACLAITPDGKHLVSGDGQGVVRIWSLPTGDMLVRCRTDASDGVASLAVSPDGTIAATGTHTNVRLWSIPEGKPLKTLESGISWIYAMAISPDGQSLAATGNGTKSVYLWKIPEGTRMELKGHAVMDLNSLAFSPDGRYLASGGKDQDVRLWRSSDGMFLGVLEDHPGHVTSIAITPDGELAAVGSADGSVTLWQVV